MVGISLVLRQSGMFLHLIDRLASYPDLRSFSFFNCRSSTHVICYAAQIFSVRATCNMSCFASIPLLRHLDLLCVMVCENSSGTRWHQIESHFYLGFKAAFLWWLSVHLVAYIKIVTVLKRSTTGAFGEVLRCFSSILLRTQQAFNNSCYNCG